MPLPHYQQDHPLRESVPEMSTSIKCFGRYVPFGVSYTEECRSCQRSQHLVTAPHGQWWLGPIECDGACPHKIKEST